VNGVSMELSIRNVAYRVYPSKRQEKILEGWLGLHRELYNASLSERKEAYRRFGKSISYNDQQNVLPEIKSFRPDLIPLGSQALQETLRRVDRGMKAFFRRVKAGLTPGYPRFRSRDRFDSFSYPGPAGWTLLHDDNHVRVQVSNLGSLKTMGKSRFNVQELERRCLTVHRKNGKWYVTVSFRGKAEAFVRQSPLSGTATGIDAGATNLGVLADGSVIENPKTYLKALRQIAHLQRDVSRKKRGSGRRRKAIRILAKAHSRLADKRKDALHKASTKLASSYDVIGYEGDLRIAGMTRSARGTVEVPGRNVAQKAGLNRSLLDASISTFIGMIEYKAVEAGAHFVPVDKAGTTVDCCHCGHKNPLQLANRTYRCRYCRIQMDRDHNAAINIMLRALQVRQYGTYCRGEGIDTLWETGHHNQIAQAIGYW